MTTKKQWTRSTRLTYAGLALAALVPLTGCDPVNGMFALVKSTATDAILDTATQTIGGAVDDLVGGLIPDLKG